MDPAFTRLLMACMGYGYGLPRRMEADQVGAFAKRMAFEMKKAEAAKPASPEGTVVDGDDQLQLVRSFDLKEPQ